MNIVKMKDVRIPNGINCGKCSALFNTTQSTGKYGDYYCFLFKKRLGGSGYAISGTRDPWGRNERGWTNRKCRECLDQYPDSKEETR